MTGIYVVDIADAQQQFEQFFISLGFEVPAGGLIYDGRNHRFQVGPKKNLDGSYIFWPNGFRYDGRPRGCITNWKTPDILYRWRFTPSDLTLYMPTPQELEARKKQALRDQAEQQALQTQAWQDMCKHYRKTIPADPEHPYLLKKHIQAYRGSLRQHKGSLQVPFRNIRTRVLTTLQWIGQTGRKGFMKNCKITDEGAYIIDGDVGPVFIAEGMATAESAAAALTASDIGFSMILAAGSAQRLCKVAETVYSLMPESKVFLLADDDWQTEAEQNNNPGLKEAKKILKSGLADGILIPPVRSLKYNDGLTDWNDYVCFCGVEKATWELEKQLKAFIPKYMA